jgi:hypothetical protein
VGVSPLAAAIARPDIAVVGQLIAAGAQVDRDVVLATCQAHSERALRAGDDAKKQAANYQETRKVTDLLVPAIGRKELGAILHDDPEVSRLLAMTADVRAAFSASQIQLGSERREYAQSRALNQEFSCAPA